VTNPVDVAGGTDADPSLFADCARAILKDPAIGGLLIVGLFGGYGLRFAEHLSLMEEDAAHQMGKLMSKTNKPVVIHSLYSSERPHSLELCRYYNIPVHDSLDVACKCVGALCDYGHYLSSYHAKASFLFNWGAKAKTEGKRILSKALAEGRRLLMEHEAKALLRIHGGWVNEDHLAASEDEAVAYAEKLACPVSMKVVSPDIVHKSDAGGVKLDLTDEKSVRRAFRQIMDSCRDYKEDADIRGILISPMVPAGIEVIIGTKIDEQFGPIIMYGLGGIMVEILKDVSFRVLPISRHSAKMMIRETKSAPILKGVRGNPPCDEKALINLLLVVSELVESYPEIEEMDLNPVIVLESGLRVVDARIILKTSG
jgi:acetyltransferase